MIDLDAIHADLGYTPEEASELKQIRLVWKKLETLRQKAASDQASAKQYRDLLQKSLRQLRSQRAGDSWLKDYQDYLAWQDSVVREKGISEIERMRGGKPWLEWSEQWIPKQYWAYCHAVGQVCENPSPANIQTSKIAFGNLVQAYVDAIAKGLCVEPKS